MSLDDCNDPSDDELWRAAVDAVEAQRATIPKHMLTFASEIASRISQYGNEHQVIVPHMTIMLASLIGGMAMMEADHDPSNAAAIDAYLLFTQAAIRAQVARAEATRAHMLAPPASEAIN